MTKYVCECCSVHLNDVSGALQRAAHTDRLVPVTNIPTGSPYDFIMRGVFGADYHLCPRCEEAFLNWDIRGLQYFISTAVTTMSNNDEYVDITRILDGDSLTEQK